MNRREWQQEQTYVIEAGQRAARIIQELAVRLQEADERILVLETNRDDLIAQAKRLGLHQEVKNLMP